MSKRNTSKKGRGRGRRRSDSSNWRSSFETCNPSGDQVDVRSRQEEPVMALPPRAQDQVQTVVGDKEEENKLKDLTCTVCLDIFTDPKVLPCCHTFCLECLKEILGKAATQENISCPQCRVEHKVPATGPSAFLSDLSLAHDIGSMELSKSSQQTHICEQCDQGDAAISFCSDCHLYLCEFCSQAHKRMKSSKNHSLFSVDTLQEKGLPLAKTSPSSFLCSVHPSQELKLFCKTCRLLVCCTCIVNEHKGHDLGEFDSTTRKEFEDEVKKLVAEAENKIAEFERNLEYVLEVERKVQSQPKELKTEISNAFDPLITAFEKRRAELLSEAEKSSEENLKELWAQKDYLENTLTGLNSSYRYANRLQESGKDSEMMMMYSQNLTLTQFKQMEKRKWNGISTRKIESSQIRFSTNNYMPILGNLHYVCLSSHTVQLESGIDFTIDSPVKAELGKEVTVTLRCDQHPRIKAYFAEYSFNVGIHYGKSQSSYGLALHFNNGKFISYPMVKQNQDNCSISVTFIPVVSGKHAINVETSGHRDNLKSKAFQLTVTGFPPCGAKVIINGADWYCDENASQNYQLKTGVVHGSPQLETSTVKVNWDYRKPVNNYYGSIDGYVDGKIVLVHKWGLDDNYPIKLSIDESNYRHYCTRTY